MKGSHGTLSWPEGGTNLFAHMEIPRGGPMEAGGYEWNEGSGKGQCVL